MLAAGKQFLKHVVPAVIKPLRVLWNEVIGFVFLAFGVIAGFNTWRNYTQGQNAGSPLLLIMGGGFTLMLVYFGVSSFLRARRISRS